MSAFKPEDTVLEKWVYTRKANRQLGKFIHPGLFSTDGLTTDAGLFIFAVVIELAIATTVMILNGFDVLIVAASLAMVAVDFILAYQLHSKKQNNICKEICQIQLLKYREKNNLFEPEEDDETIMTGITACEHAIKKYKTRQFKYKIGIILSAMVKIAGFIILIDLGPALDVFGGVLFSFAAYIHISHTGYFLFYVSFSMSYKKGKDFFLSQIHDKQISVKDKISPNEIEQIPTAVKAELINLANQKRKNLEPTTLVLFGPEEKADEHKLLCIIQKDEQNNLIYTFILQTCGLIEDKELISFVNNTGMKDSIKSFIGYFGLLIQHRQLTKEKINKGQVSKEL